MGNKENSQNTEVHQPAPKKQTVGEKFKSGCVEIFGQFVTAKFWKDFVATFVKEAIKSVCLALGGTFIKYGRKGRDEEVDKIVNNYGSNYSGYSNDNVFNNNQSRGQNFGYNHSDSRIPVGSNPNGDNRFPGF